MKKDKEVVKSEDIFDRYKKSQRGTWSQQAVDDRAFVANVMWETDDANALDAADQPALTINETTPARDQIVSQLTKNSPRWASYGKEKSDVTIASRLSDLMEHIWYISDADTSNSKATEDFIDVGVWCMMTYVDTNADYGRGEIKITDLDPLEVYIDPNSKRLDTEDAAHKLIVKKCTREYIKTMYPDFDFKDAHQTYDDDIPETTRDSDEDHITKVTDDQDAEYYLIIDRYTKIKQKRYHVKTDEEHLFDKKEYDEFWNEPAIILTTQQEEAYAYKPDDVQYWMDIMNTYGTIVHQKLNTFVDDAGQVQQELEFVSGTEYGDALPGSTTQITPTNKGYLITQGIIEVSEPLVDRIQRVLSIGGKLYYKDILPMSIYPIQTTMNHHQRNPFPSGDIRLIRPLQEQLNKITSKITAYISAIVNLIGFVPQGSNIKKQIEDQAGKAGLKLYEVDTDVGAPPSFAQYPPLPAGIFEDRQRIISQIQRIMGAYPFLDGDAGNAPETYRATLVIQEEGMNRANYKRKKIENAINNLAKGVAELIPKVYTERKVVRLLKPNHKVKETIFNDTSYESGAREIINDISTINADIMMVSGSMLPTNRWARSEYYTGLYEKGILQDASVILRESEIPDVEDIIAKQDKLVQLTQYVQQLEGQIKDLQGDMQTKTRENVHLKEKVEVEKVKGDLDRLKNRVERDTMVTGMRLKDQEKSNKEKSKNQEDTP